MSEQLTDDEQIEKLKKWWKENGIAIIMGVVIGLGGVVGVRYYFSYQEQQMANASDVYSNFVNAYNVSDAIVMQQNVDTLQADYADSSYSAFASISYASFIYQKGDVDLAITYFNWVISHPGHESNAHFARIHLVRIYIEQGKLDEANQLLANVSEPAFDGQYAEARGDILAAQGDSAGAAEQYKVALSDENMKSNRRNLVLMKLNELEVASK